MYIIKKLFSGRIFITIVLLLVQIVWTTLFFLRLTKYSVALSILFGILSVLIVLHLVGSDMNPAYRTVWIRTGCTLSSAIASNLAKGYSLKESIANAKKYLTGALKTQLNLGKGSGPLEHTYIIKY